MNDTARLAREITWRSSKQSFLTARLLADRDLVDDCLRAYAYFRWADDRIDLSLRGRDERMQFIRTQRQLIEQLQRNERPEVLSPEEEMLADLIAHSRGRHGELQSFIYNFLSVFEFDAERAGRLVSRRELAAYTSCLATAVMDGIQYFIGNGHPYPRTRDRSLAVTGAHVTHMLRDTLEDLSAGFVNIPEEYLDAHCIHAQDVRREPYRAWVRDRVELARTCLHAGKAYVDSLDVLRCKLAGMWYCARFERILDAIERDGYLLRAHYPVGRGVAAWIEMAWLGIVTASRHFWGRIRLVFSPCDPPLDRDPESILSITKGREAQGGKRRHAPSAAVSREPTRGGSL